MDNLKVFRIEWLDGAKAWFVDYNDDDALTHYLEEVGRVHDEPDVDAVYREDEDATIETDDGFMTVEEILDDCDEPMLIAEDK